MAGGIWWPPVRYLAFISRTPLTSGNKIGSNTIGGTGALGDGLDGVVIENAANNQIGNNSEGGNQIGGNGDGICITGSGATGNSVPVERDRPGSIAHSAPQPNGGNGISILAGAEKQHDRGAQPG